MVSGSRAVSCQTLNQCLGYLNEYFRSRKASACNKKQITEIEVSPSKGRVKREVKTRR